MHFKKPDFWDYKKISFWVIVLFPLSIIYQITHLIIKFFKLSKPLRKFQIPIICIGNIYLGGTGKTPLVREIFKITKSLNKNPALIKKSYPFLDDEIMMLKKLGKIFTYKDRNKSISSAINHNYNVAILDDGFQDFSIKPDLSILCFNSKQLIGNGFLIPAGPLRENLSSIKRADCVVINGNKNIYFEDKIRKVNSNIKVFYSKYKINNLDEIINKKVLAFAGIGNPQNFFDLLYENNIDVKKIFSFPDHHNYSENDYNKIFNNQEIDLVVTTEKDYYRLNEKIKKKIYCIKVELEIENENEIRDLIKNYL